MTLESVFRNFNFKAFKDLDINRKMKTISDGNSNPITKEAIIKDGVIEKRRDSKKLPNSSWRPKFCVLTAESLTLHKKASSDDTEYSHRISLMEVTSVEKIEKGRRHIHFDLVTRMQRLGLRVPSKDVDWLIQIQLAVVACKNRDDFRRELTTKTSLIATKYNLKKNPKNLEEVILDKDAEYGDGIGITIRRAGGCIVVSRILPDGPVERTQKLQPGDEILNVNGIEILDQEAEEVAQQIRSIQGSVVLLIKPLIKSQDGADDSEQDISTSTRPPFFERGARVTVHADMHNSAYRSYQASSPRGPSCPSPPELPKKSL
ncbi:uncharacterized protein LOC117122012 isoform X2 [Anneissia japonica]|uniref:uncharacterized protein LOC117122012 isoform X2 n=1 Tax=Anneissia japonica TaxID=1529436 RepID=UPI0014254C5C|nr:uncharacterized protein LOC117122012 isoform X2 [Anneissia japonica]